MEKHVNTENVEIDQSMIPSASIDSYKNAQSHKLIFQVNWEKNDMFHQFSKNIMYLKYRTYCNNFLFPDMQEYFRDNDLNLTKEPSQQTLLGVSQCLLFLFLS